MINTSNIKSGDTFSINRKTFLGKSIAFFMQLFAKNNHIKSEFIPTHQGKLFWEGDVLMIYESNNHVFKKRPFLDYYFETDDFIITTPKVSYSPIQIYAGQEYAEWLLEHQRGYQWLNFISWVVYVLSFKKIYIFRKSELVTFCFEAGCRIEQKMNPFFVTWDLESSDCFKLINSEIYKTTDLNI